jgi:hypothetical protein
MRAEGDRQRRPRRRGPGIDRKRLARATAQRLRAASTSRRCGVNLNPNKGNPHGTDRHHHQNRRRRADLDAQAHVTRLLQGYGGTALHPHVPFVADGLSGPVVMWRASCTATTCGLYVQDSPTGPPVTTSAPTARTAPTRAEAPPPQHPNPAPHRGPGLGAPRSQPHRRPRSACHGGPLPRRPARAPFVAQRQPTRRGHDDRSRCVPGRQLTCAPSLRTPRAAPAGSGR